MHGTNCKYFCTDVASRHSSSAWHRRMGIMDYGLVLELVCRLSYCVSPTMGKMRVNVAFDRSLMWSSFADLHRIFQIQILKQTCIYKSTLTHLLSSPPQQKENCLRLATARIHSQELRSSQREPDTSATRHFGTRKLVPK